MFYKIPFIITYLPGYYGECITKQQSSVSHRFDTLIVIVIYDTLHIVILQARACQSGTDIFTSLKKKTFLGHVL